MSDMKRDMNKERHTMKKPSETTKRGIEEYRRVSENRTSAGGRDGGEHVRPDGHRTANGTRSASGSRDAVRHSDPAHRSSASHGASGRHSASSAHGAPSAHGASAYNTGSAHRSSAVHGSKNAHHSKKPTGSGNVLEKIKDLAVKLWTVYRFETIAVGTLILAIAIAVPVIIHSINVNKKPTSEDINLEEYGELFADEDGSTPTTTTNANGVRVRVDEETGEEVEDPTILAEVKNGGEGYLNHCIFLGDSRYVGLVSYAVISDEDVLAQVGIAHPSVEGFTFTQNSGKQYTLKSYLAAKSGDRDVIYIGYGVNGMKGADEETYQKQYKTLIEHIMEMAPESKIVIMSIWPVDDEGTYKGSVKNEWIDKYNEFLMALAEYEGIYYLDVNTVLKDKNGSINRSYDGGDGLHYNARGYEAIRSYILSHPVPGIPTDGAYTVHYVPPTGQFKDMVKDKVNLPAASPSPTGAHEHEWVDDEVLTKATCTEPGLKRVKCSCGVTAEREIPALGHKFGDDGTAEFCTRCGEKNPNFKGEKVAEVKPTPTPTPEPTKEPTPEPTKEPTKEPEKPTPEPTKEEKHEHSWGEWSETSAPTCTEKGTKTRKCTECGAEQTAEIPAKGHDFSDGGKTCKNCSEPNPDYREPSSEEPTTEEPTTEEPTTEEPTTQDPGNSGGNTDGAGE